MKTRFSAKALCLSALLLTSVGGLISCTDNSEQGATGSASTPLIAQDLSPVRNHALLSYLPQNAIGYYLFDYTIDSAQKFLKTAWSGKDIVISESINNLIAQSGTELKEAVLLTELEGQGLIPAAKSNGKIQQIVAALSIEKDPSGMPMPGVAIYETFVAGTDVSNPILGIKAKMEAKGIKVAALKVEGVQGFTFELALSTPQSEPNSADGSVPDAPPAVTKPVKLNVAVAGKAPRLMIATSPELINKEFILDQPSKNTRFAQIQADPEFKRALSTIPSEKTEFSYGYADLHGVIDQVSAAAGDVKEVQDALKKFPIRAAVLSRSMNDSLTDRAAVTLVSDTNQSLGGLDELNKNSPTTFASQLPSELVGFISLDGALLRSIGQSILESTPAEEKPQVQGVYDQVKSITEIGLAVRPQKGASPLPELAILVNSNEAQALIDNASGLISLGAASQGILPPFQKKQVEGVNVEFAMSPFGAGVFLAANGQQAIVASSEGILGDIIKNSKDSKGSALESLSADTKSMLSSANPLMLMHVDYSRVAALIDSLTQSLGIFTGGQPLVEAKVLENLRAYGQSSIAFSFSNRVLQFVNRTETVAPPKV